MAIIIIKMVLDPLSVLSIAASVIQFTDFTCKVIAKGNEYRKSASGALAEHVDLENIAAKFHSLSANLESSIHPYASTSNLSPDELALKGLAQSVMRRPINLSSPSRVLPFRALVQSERVLDMRSRQSGARIKLKTCRGGWKIFEASWLSIF